MIFRRRRKASAATSDITFSLEFHVTDVHGRPVDPSVLDVQTDGLAELLGGLRSALYRDLDIDASLSEGVVTFSVGILEPEFDPQLVVKQMLIDIGPAISAVGGSVMTDEPREVSVRADQPVWQPVFA